MLNEEALRPTILEVNINNFKYNVEKIKEYIGDKKDLIPVIKADAYGTEINTKLELIKDFKMVAVALTGEAIYLRQIGFENNILILNQPFVTDIDDIIKYNLTVGVARLEFLKLLNDKNKELKNDFKINVHIEVETGMNRTGFKLEDLKSNIQIIKALDGVNIEGVYSHLSSADINKEYTEKQISIFREAKEFLLENIDTIKYYHIEASTGTINYNLDDTNAVRPGIILYGYNAIENQKDKIDLKPIAKFKSKINFIKELNEGERIGYSGSYITDKKTIVATVPLGYADGMPRCLSNVGEVVVNGKKAKIIGKVCMDNFMLDVTDIQDVSVGTDVYIWDNDVITLEDMAEKAGTINYEVISRIAKRVRREFI